MTNVNAKSHVLSKFNDIKNRLVYILNEVSLVYNTEIYNRCLKEVLQVLHAAIAGFENIYFKYFLFPKLQNLEQYARRNSRDRSSNP